MFDTHSRRRNGRRLVPCGFLWTAIASIGLAGCGAHETLPRASVSGIVYTNGVELKSGIVRFVPINGTKGPIVTASVSDGLFSLPAESGPVVGTHRVEFEATNFLGFDPGDQAAAEAALRKNGGKLPVSPVALNYRKRSPVTAEVPPEGAQGLVFLLKHDAHPFARRNSLGNTGIAAAR